MRKQPILQYILLAIVAINAMVSGSSAVTTQHARPGTITTSGMLPQPYVNATFADPVLSSVDTGASRALVDDLLHSIIKGTGTAADGAVALPNVEPPSLMVTRDVVEALVAVDGLVPGAAAIASWVWSRYHASGGYFDDEYSVNWSVVQDGAGWIATNRYSPVVATGCALDTLSMLDQAVPSTVNDSVRAFILSCHDAVTGKFKGKPGTVEPTLQDAVWAIKALWLMGRLNTIDAGTCAAAITASVNGYGLFTFHVPTIIVPTTEYMGGTIPVTRLAIDALQQLGQLGTIDLAATRASVMALYSGTGKHFLQDWSSSTKTCLATADALRILDGVGFPAGFVQAELPGIVEEFARSQLPGGGWAIDDGASLAATNQVARVVTELVNVAGTTGTVDLAKIRDVFATSLAVNFASGMAAYCPFPANHPSLLAGEALTTLAARHGMVDAAAEDAARQLVTASYADGSGTYPWKYPGAPSLAYMPAGEFRTYGTGGIVALAARVALKDAMSVPFTLAELNEIAAVLDSLQYTSFTIPGIQGLCLARHDMAIMLSTPGVAPRLASLEDTVAALRVIETLRGYGNGTWFLPARFLDLAMLYGRLASGYRESGTVAWFEREYPVSFQQPSGLDDARLRDTRLAVEAISLAHGFTHAAITATVNLAKVVNFALTEPRRTVTDIENAAAILAMVNATTTLAQRVALVAQVQSFKMQGTAWYCRIGLPSMAETTKAFAVMSRFSGIVASLGHVVASGMAVDALAGTTVALSCTLSNCFAGPGAPGTFNYSIAAIGASGTNVRSPSAIPIPLEEAKLGPASIDVGTGQSSLAPSITIPITVTGVLYLPFVDGRVVVTTTGREPFTAQLDLRLVNPDDTTKQASVHDAKISAAGLSIDHDAFFAVDAAAGSGRYQTVLNVNPLGDETLYRLVATRSWCKGLDMQLAVRCSDNLSYSPTVVFPLAAVALGVVLPLAYKRHARRVVVTLP